MASLIVEEHILQEALKAGLAKDAAKYHSGATPARLMVKEWWCMFHLFGAPRGRVQSLPRWVRINRLT